MHSNNLKVITSLLRITYTFIISLCAVYFVVACSNETTDSQDPFIGSGTGGVPATGTSGVGDSMGASGIENTGDLGGAPALDNTGGTTVVVSTGGVGGSIPPTSGGAGGIVATGGTSVVVETGGVVDIGGTGGIVDIGGTGGIVETGGTGPVAGTDIPPGAVVPPRCTGDDRTVAMVGDSYWALTGGIYKYLRQFSGQQYRPYYINATMMSGGVGNIPSQARTAYAVAPVKTLLMDGGGNDCIMNTSCTTMGMASQTCMRAIDNALDVACDMLHEAVDNGVQEIIFFYYPHNINAMWSRYTNPICDYAIPIIQPCCENLPGADCTFIDTREAFKGHELQYFSAVDGFHPTDAGSKVIAELMWAAMEENCQNGIDLSP